MRYDLAALAKRATNRRRSSIAIRPISPTQALASNLYLRGYRPIIAVLTSAIPHIVAAYERAQPVHDGAIRDAASDLQPTLNGLGDQLQRLVLTLAPALRSWTARVERWHRGKWRGNVLSATGVDLDTVLAASGEPTSVADTIAWNTVLVKDLSDQARARMASAVFAAIQQRQPAADLARDLRDVVAMSRQRSLRIASDQLTKLSGALDRERASDAGLRSYTWRWSHKLHGRPEHIARDGHAFQYAKPPADGPPGTLPFCGCRAQARLELA